MLKDYYQLPADKSVEHLSSRLLVQLYQDQQNHSGVGLNLPHCLSVLSKFFPRSFFIFCHDFPAGSRDKVHAEWSSCPLFHIWHSKKIIIYEERKERFAVSDNSSASCYHGTLLMWGCWCKCTWAAWWHAGQAWWQWIIWGKGMGHAESSWQSRNWMQAKAVWAFVQLSGSVLGLLGCHGIPGLSFKSTSTDLWAGWRPIKPAAILHGGSLWSSAKLWNSSWALSWFFWHSDKCKPKASTQILPNYGECAKMEIIFKYLPLFCGLWDGHRDTKQ